MDWLGEAAPQPEGSSVCAQQAPASLGNGGAPANAGDRRDTGLIPVSGRSPGGGHGNPLQYSCLENPMDRRGWQATVPSVAKSRLN